MLLSGYGGFITRLRVRYLPEEATQDLVLYATHGTESEVCHDERRTRFLEEQGWMVLRVWNIDVFTGWNAVCDTILLALEART